MRKSFAAALHEYRADPRNADAAQALIVAFQGAMGLRTRPGEVERAALSALEQVPLLIQARIVVVVSDFLEGECEADAAIEEIRACVSRWKTIRL